MTHIIPLLSSEQASYAPPDIMTHHWDIGADKVQTNILLKIIVFYLIVKHIYFTNSKLLGPIFPISPIMPYFFTQPLVDVEPQ